jgi:hypothetical protein
VDPPALEPPEPLEPPLALEPPEPLEPPLALDPPDPLDPPVPLEPPFPPDPLPLSCFPASPLELSLEHAKVKMLKQNTALSPTDRILVGFMFLLLVIFIP